MIKIGPIEKLGTIWFFEFFDLEKKDLDKIENKIFQIMDNFENDYSRFLENSKLNILNKNKIFENPDKEFLELLSLAEKSFFQTNGAFNILVGDFLEKSGYDKKYSFKAQKKLPKIPDFQEAIFFDKNKIILKGDFKIDFGGFGKGYLIDKLAFFLKENKIKHFLINGGGDIYATENKKKKGFEIFLKNPQDEKKIFAKIILKNEALCVSSSFYRKWQSENKEFSHLVGSENPENSFVISKKAVDADIWATALSINSKIKNPKNINFLKNF